MFNQKLPLLALCVSLLLGGCQNATAAVGRSENADLVFGGPGSGEGQFVALRDLTFDPQGTTLYTLESNEPLVIGRGGPTVQGGARVQKFDASGKFLGGFSLGDVPAWTRGSGQPRLAVDSKGQVAVSLPQQDLVRLFDAKGQKTFDVPVVGALAVASVQTAQGERFAVAAWKRTKKGREIIEIGGDAIQLVDAATGKSTPLPLSQSVSQPFDLASGPNGSLWVLVQSQILGFDQKGKLIRTIGSGLRRRVEDGSEPQGGLALDSRGNIYAAVGGNPVLIGRYSTNGKTVMTQRGQFKFADSWGYGPTTPLALDKNDRLWVGSTAYRDAQNSPRSHFSPAVIRTVAGFYKGSGVQTSDARVLGFSARVSTLAPYNIFYDLSPAKCEFIVDPSVFQVKSVKVRWHVYDWRQNPVAQGRFDLPLENGQQARVPMEWTPPRFGWYSARAEIFDGDDPLTSVAAHFGVSPRTPGLVELSLGLSPGGWDDAPRQMFSGLPMMRLHIPGRTDAASLDKWMTQFAKSKAYEAQGANIIVQLAENKDGFSAERLRPAIERLKGQVRFLELCNEPNFSFSPEEFVAASKPIYALIKEVDPNFRVLGPAVCGISLSWHEAFFKAGGGATYDEFACHDYEGNESITPEHWRWKFAQLHAMMKRYGVDGRPMWQTERAISSVRSGSFLPIAGAVRVSLHADLLQTLGIPRERNLHYYLNKGGYSKVPSYLWTPEGPFPGALALRTRYAQTKGLTYAGELDFGATGNQMFMGLRFQNGAGQDVVVSLRNLGDFDQSVEFGVTGSAALSLLDSWGNASTATAKNGRVTLSVGQLPTFVRLGAGQKIVPLPLDLGRNLAPSAELSLAQGQTEKPLDTMVNGVYEGPHGDNPGRNSSWSSGPLSPTSPQVVELRWPTPRAISSVMLRSMRADNSMCALLDFDLQAFQNGAWKTIAQSRTPLPQSYRAEVSDANSIQWYGDDNIRLTRFAPVSTDRLRVVALRATYGYNGDEAGRTLNLRFRGAPPLSFLNLKEIEVYGPASPVQLAFEPLRLDKTLAGGADQVVARVSNSSGADWSGEAAFAAPPGWNVSPALARLSVAKGASETFPLALTPPAQVAAGRTLVQATLRDAKGPVDADALPVEFSSPLQLQAISPASDAKTLSLALRNNGTEPLAGTAKLELLLNGAPSGLAPVTSAFEALAPNTNGQVAFDVPGLDLSQGRWTARYSTQANGITRTLEQDLSVRSWVVVGPFESDFERAFGPEKGVDLNATYTDMMGNTMKWKTLQSNAQNVVDLASAFDKKEDAGAYAAVWVISPTARRALLSSGSDDGGKIWLNGKEVVSANTRRGLKSDSDRVEVDLKAGANLVLLKVVQSDGAWAFSFDLLDVQKKTPLSDLTYSTRAPG